MPMLDIDLADERATPRASPQRQQSSKPVIRKWLLPKGSSRATETQLAAELELLFKALCLMAWSEAAARGMRCAELWVDLPDDVREGLPWAKYPDPPHPGDVDCTEAWLVYGTWLCLWWQNETVGPDGSGKRRLRCEEYVER